jgi:hypothetical protein
MTASRTFLEHAERCAHLADIAPNQPSYRRFKRMESAWRALALEQDWLDGEIPPAAIATPMAHENKTQPDNGRRIGRGVSTAPPLGN